MSFVSNLAHSLVIEWKMSNILTKNKMNGIKKIDSNCKNVLPHTKMAGRDKNDRTNSRTFCQQNRIAFSQRAPRELLPRSGSRYSRRTGYRRAADSSFADEFGEWCPARRQGGLPLPRSMNRTLGGLEEVSTCSCTLLAALASKSW